MNPSVSVVLSWVEFVLCSVSLFITENLVLAGNFKSHASSYQRFTLKHSINAYTSFFEKWNGFRPSKRSFKKQMLEISLDEHVFNTIAQIINRLQKVLLVMCWNQFQLYEEITIKHQQLLNSFIRGFELKFNLFWLAYSLNCINSSLPCLYLRSLLLLPGFLKCLEYLFENF